MRVVSGNMSILPMGRVEERIYRVSLRNGVTVMYLNEREMRDLCRCEQQLGLVKVSEQ
ncbi:hypothetical protein [Bifidobacterium moukalabense]|uniref:hypothetical protein n=1 Tax=Bifidobacterium moukalabense TaxID=1333651 RepID=UPI00148541C5|nr:hypothetical protein [Bifidobacterium moukalabense]